MLVIAGVGLAGRASQEQDFSNGLLHIYDTVTVYYIFIT